MNLQRIVLGGLLAAVICFAGDGVVHSAVLSGSWKEIAASLNLKEHGAGFIWFVWYDLAKGIAIVLLYALIRPRLGPGPRTALFAGALVWALTIPVPLAGLLPIHFFGRKFAFTWSVVGAVPMLLAGLAGGALYQEATAAPQ
jgi:hypothetical protein